MSYCTPTKLCVNWNFLFAVAMSNSDIVSTIPNVTSSDLVPECPFTSVFCDSNNLTSFTYSSDDSVTAWLDLILVYIFSTMAIIVGIICNIINVVIFSKYSITTDSTNSFLLTLSAADLLSLVFTAFIYMTYFICFVQEHTAITSYNFIYVFGLIFNRIFYLISLDMTGVIAVQRAIAVVFPFKVSAIFSQRNTNIIIAVLLIKAWGSTLPLIMTVFNPVWVYDPYFKTDVAVTVSTSHVAHIVDYQLLVVYYGWSQSVQQVMGIAVIFLFGSMTVIKLKSHSKARGALTNVKSSATESSSMSQKERKAVKMLLTICCVSFLTFSIALMANFLLTVVAGDEFINFNYFCTSFNFLVMIMSVNAAANFFIYWSMSPKFSQCFKELFTNKKVAD